MLDIIFIENRIESLTNLINDDSTSIQDYFIIDILIQSYKNLLKER